MIENPVFVRGMSRSGGTLMVTLLDAHPRIAMSYELYPTLLLEAERIDIHSVIATLEMTADLRRAASNMPTSGLSNLVKRAPRARLDNAGLAKLFREHVLEGLGFSDPADRLRFIERCGLHNMSLAKKISWGAKCGTNFDDYAALWPKAKFINIIRDGRDVLASQLNTGDFKADPASLGRSWAKNHTKFRQLVRQSTIDGHEVIYERLIDSPREEVAAIFEFLEIPFDENVLNFHSQDLNIYAVGHMSMPALVKPINASQVGRWKRDLSWAQADAFMSEAGEAMREFGYV
jgi:hypothetical protein